MTLLHDIDDMFHLTGTTRRLLGNIDIKLGDAGDALNNNHLATAQALHDEAKEDFKTLVKHLAAGIRARSPVVPE